ncbi:unnamed protein product, partial [Brassica oleracea]
TCTNILLNKICFSPKKYNTIIFCRSKLVRLTIWDNEVVNFRELNRISTRKNQIGNYHSQPHQDRAFTLTTILIS